MVDISTCERCVSQEALSIQHPIRVVEQGNYHVIVFWSTASNDINTEYQSILCHETYHVILCKITWKLPCSTTLKG